jgi:hypothetical protein
MRLKLGETRRGSDGALDFVTWKEARREARERVFTRVWGFVAASVL